jgi:hypothetical protein
MNLEDKMFQLGQSKYYLPIVSAGFLTSGLIVLSVDSIIGGILMFEAGLFTAWAFHDLWNRHTKSQSVSSEESSNGENTQ